MAALQVVLSHAVGHTGLINRLPDFWRTAFEYLTWFPGVPVFFVISGFLISRSYENSRGDLAGYSWRRILRIYPALWVCLGVTIAVLAAFGFLGGGFATSARFPVWIAGQMTFVQFFNPEQFRDFGIGVANGALWSITVELQFYAFIPLLYAVLGRLKGKATAFLFAAMMAGSFALWCAMDLKITGPEGYGGAPVIWKLMFVTLAPHLWMFCLGILAHRHFGVVRGWVEGTFVRWLVAYVVLMGLREWLFDPRSAAFYAGYFPSRVLLALVTLSAAYSARSLSEKLLRGQDISYGIYIYHSIVINIFVELGWLRGLADVVWICVISAAVAWLSWVVVEKPSLACKSANPMLWWRRVRKGPEVSP